MVCMVWLYGVLGVRIGGVEVCKLYIIYSYIYTQLYIYTVYIHSSDEISTLHGNHTPLYLGHTLHIPLDEVRDRNKEWNDRNTEWNENNSGGFSNTHTPYGAHTPQLPHIAFNSGGSGYILNAIALQALVEHIDAEYCMPDAIVSVYVFVCILYIVYVYIFSVVCLLGDGC